MMNKLALIFFLLASIIQFSAGNENLLKQDFKAKGLVVINGTEYYVSPGVTLNTVYQAYEFCNDVGMSLVSLETKEEYDSVTQYLLDQGLNGYYYWTSGQLLTDNVWIWSGSGQLFSYVKWDINQPDDLKNCPCVYLRTGADGLIDVPCGNNYEYGFICE